METEMQENVNVTLPLNPINAVLQYLGTRSYAERSQLVQTLHADATPQMSAAAATPGRDGQRRPHRLTR